MRALASLLLTLWGMAALAAANEPVIVLGSVGAKLDEYVTRLEAVGFSGLLLVAKDGKVILQKGYGLADREAGVRYTPDTVFDIGSITKQFTAAAILRLEMQGKLKVEDSISRYFDAVPEDKRGITLHQLLTHTSGLVAALGEDFDVMSRDMLVRKALASKLLASPGERYEYSNVGYSLLAVVIEKLAGQPYEAFLNDQLFKPAEMTRTGYLIPQWQQRELAHGYQVGSPWGTPLDHPWAKDGPWWNLRANGGLLSTLADMYKWHQALLGEKILSASAKAKLFAPHVAEDESGETHYGYGWVLSTTARNTQLIAHNGGNGILSADFLRFIDENAVIIGGAAQSQFQLFPVTHKIGELLFGAEVPMPPAAAHLEANALVNYTGVYRLASGGTLEVSAAVSSLTGEPAVSITPTTRAEFEALMGKVTPEVRARLGNREARLLSALQQTRQGIYLPLSEIFDAPLDQVKRSAARITHYEARFGAFERMDLLGTVVRGQRISTWIRFLFSKGPQVFEYVWGERGVTYARAVEGLGSSFYLSAAGSELFSHDPRNLSTQRFTLERDEDGRPAALIFHGVNGEARATRWMQ